MLELIVAVFTYAIVNTCDFSSHYDKGNVYTCNTVNVHVSESNLSTMARVFKLDL